MSVLRNLALGALVAAAVSGAASRAPAPERPRHLATRHSPFPLTVTDDAGRRVRFAVPPKRIVSLAPAHTETLYALGAGGRVVAADTYSDYPPAARRKAKLDCWPRPPLEQIVAARPDLVVVFTEGTDFLSQMEAAHVPTLKLFPGGYDAALREIELLGRVVEAGKEAHTLVNSIRRRTAVVRRRIRGTRAVRTMFELDATDPARPYVAGGAGLYGDILQLAGGRNVFADLKVPAAQTSVEQVVARDPEVILMGDTRSPVNPQSAEKLGLRPGWAGVAAVRGRRVYQIVSDRLTRPGPRIIEGLENVARLLHPERFR